MACFGGVHFLKLVKYIFFISTLLHLSHVSSAGHLWSIGRGLQWASQG